ncbi:MAG TPA: glycoside hydrolase family 43 protein [Anaerohalosphaeraceae bacterium]|nr:glycoside hydrolase family 43 protein [Anaerohalosphaeraceae bacterium]HOL32481.1 glycoside hydrolase family 43 protein [Anaerohalosphaeraceae bacterium]HOM76153.1 glycoside hydrolase family 43 protein [Anaerohalosphaeraceae bacterium]HPO69917.1 glycoside hydrolase family 43 protein [Anaerohalosphaeraceae bacterium]
MSNRVKVCIFIVLICANAGLGAEEPNQLETVWLFSYFKGNGEDGLHLAYSTDGMVWRPLKNDESFLRPQVAGKLMRDPSICRGPDGLFHMVWTTGWWDKGIGLAHSKDLMQWSRQEFLGVMEQEPAAKNCWAPEIFFDESTQTYLIFWATTVPGRFPQTDNPRDDNNHRIYYITTKDFKTYTDTALFYDPGFNVIDAFIANAGQRYVMFFKNETKHPKTEKNIRMAFADRASGPYGPPSEPITGKYWAEGPAAVKIGSRWIVYFDKYTERRYGAVVSEDLVNWQDISGQVEFPGGARHGTVFPVSRDVAEKLLKTGTER